MIRKTRLGSYFFILAYSIVFGLLLGEFATRFLSLSKTWTTKKEVQRHNALIKKYFDHAKLGHRYKPNVTFTSILDKSYFINADGFRDIEFTKDSTRTLIAFLGSSIIEGLGVVAESRATNIAKTIINIEIDNKIDIFNFGIGASSTFDELHILQNQVLHYEPDYVVLQIGFNDLTANWSMRNVNISNAINKEKDENEIIHGQGFVKAFFQNHSALYLYIAEYYNHQLLKGNKVNSVLSKVLQDNVEHWNLFYDLLGQFAAMCSENNIEPIIMYVPYEVEVLVNADSLGTRTNKLISAHCMSHNIDYIDVTEVLRNAHNKEELYFDFSHLTKRGNNLVGKAIAKHFTNKFTI